MRLRILGDPRLMDQIREVRSSYFYKTPLIQTSKTQPELIAALNDPHQFSQVLQQTSQRRYQADLQRQAEIAKLNEDPFNVDAQRKIEELIRREAVEENMQHALDYSPESFGTVTML